MGKIDLVRQILDILRREEARAGFHIREQWLADALGVSRSPVRTALRQLEELSVVRSAQNQGYFLEIEADSDAFLEIALPETETDRIYRLMASERFANLIGDQVSVGSLVKRYGIGRALILKVLARMQEDGLVEKTAGHGWVFGPALNDEAAYLESYRYRLLIEPAALTEEDFALPASSIERLKRSHLDMLEGAVFTSPLTRLFDVDAEFHQTLAAACGNRFLSQAIGQQTKLRRLSEYEKYAPRERLSDSLREHLTILEAIERGDRQAAAAGMRAHTRKSHENRPDFRKVRVLAHRRLTRR